MIAKLLIPFVVLIFASVPIAFSQGLASLFLMSVEDVISGESFVKGITAGLNSFTLCIRRWALPHACRSSIVHICGRYHGKGRHFPETS